MIDPVTGRPLRVSTDGTSGPYIMVPPTLSSAVAALLVTNNITHVVTADTVRTGSTTVYDVFDLGMAGDATAVQNILDSVRD
jgi:hypothetical protein